MLSKPAATAISVSAQLTRLLSVRGNITLHVPRTTHNIGVLTNVQITTLKF